MTPMISARLPLRAVAIAVGGMLGLSACGSGSSGSKQLAAESMEVATPGIAAGTSNASSLVAVDACSLLTAIDFATATDKVQPKGFPASSYTLSTQKVKTDVSPAVDQHSACTYHFSGHPGASGEITLDVMTAAEYKNLGAFERGKPIGELGDEAAVYGQRPAVRRGDRAALIANSSSSIAFSKEILRILVSRLRTCPQNPRDSLDDSAFDRLATPRGPRSGQNRRIGPGY